MDTSYYSVQRACSVLDCDDETILAAIHSGELRAIDIRKNLDGKRPTWRIAESELGRWLLKRGNAIKQEEVPRQAKQVPSKRYV